MPMALACIILRDQPDEYQAPLELRELQARRNLDGEVAFGYGPKESNRSLTVNSTSVIRSKTLRGDASKEERHNASSATRSVKPIVVSGPVLRKRVSYVECSSGRAEGLWQGIHVSSGHETSDNPSTDTSHTAPFSRH